MKFLPNILSILLATLAGPSISAQAAKAPVEIKETDRMDNLLALANRVEASEPQEALRAAREGLQLARQKGDPEKVVAFLGSVAFCSAQTGELLEAVKYGNEALTLSTRLGNRERMAKAHNILGIAYTFMGSYSHALDEGLEALRLREELGLTSATLQSLNLIGIIYHHSGQYPKAIEYYQKILERIGKNPDPPHAILSHLNIGFAKYKMGLYPDALKYHLMALEESRKAHEQSYLLYAYLNLGMTYTEMANYPEAGKYLQMAVAGYQGHDNKHGRIQVLNAMARLCFLTKEYDKGIQLAKNAADLAEQIKARDELKISYELLSTIYEKKGDTPNALAFYRRYSTTKDSIFTTQESDKIADISMKIVTLKKDNEIESLKKEHVISSLKIQKGRYVLFVLLFGTISLSLFVALLIGHGKKTRDAKHLLEFTNRRLQALNEELQENIREINTLSGLLPICAQCKKIRDDDGYWQQLESYISKHSSATFSHGICPHCADELYPEMKEARENPQQ